MTDEEAIRKIWERKEDGREVFAHAELCVDVQMTDYTPSMKKIIHTAKAGTRVLITMASRFGDFGIRDERTDAIVHGYLARVLPEKLRNIKFVPGAEGNPWKKEGSTYTRLKKP